MRQTLAIILALGALWAAERTCLAQGEAGVDGASDESLEVARRHFEDALRLVGSEQWDEALRAFEASMSAHPTSVACFNLCLCLRRMERDAEAMACYQRFLQRFGDEAPAEDRAEVDREVARLRTALGRIAVDVGRPETAQVWLDGAEVGETPLEHPIYVTPGRHSLEVRAEGFVPARREVELEAGSQAALLVSLERAEGGLGTVLISSPLPGVAVSLDGEQIGVTPFLDEALVVAAGSHRIVASRSGYGTEEIEVTVAASESRRVSLVLSPAGQIPAENGGVLDLRVSEQGAEVLLDGAPLRPGPVPAGPHALEVRLEGFQTWTGELDVPAGETTTVAVDLRPTPAHLEEYLSRARAFRGAGYATSALGVALLGTTLALFFWNESRDEQWSTENDALRDPAAPERDRRLAENADLLDAIETLDVVNWVLLGVGVASLGVGLGLLIGGPRLGRYSPVSITPSPGGMVLQGSW